MAYTQADVTDKGWRFVNSVSGNYVVERAAFGGKLTCTGNDLASAITAVEAWEKNVSNIPTQAVRSHNGHS